MCLFCCSADVFLILLAILFPPLPVWIKRGICSADSLINIALCMLGFIPGLLHSWYIIARFPEEPFIDADIESQDFARSRHEPGITTFYTRQQFAYSPIPQQDLPSERPSQDRQQAAANEFRPPAASVPAAGPSSNNSDDHVPPSYDDVLKDNKIQRNDY
ncbi:hypothetical protein V1514DRAFT_325310 [Lipomyces japonicus]|uniref:uncharacterized protein n=1 Tax=Lipomyces japonicus TaxID=56871 RepID=UPI0034CDF1F2